MPDKNETFDTMEITQDEILTADELNTGAADTVETTDGAAETEPEIVEDVREEITDESSENGEPEIDVIDVMAEKINELAELFNTVNARLAALEAKANERDAREAARAKKLNGFFAPIKDGKDPDADPLPRVEKKYTF